MENKDSRRMVPLSVQIAMASVGNDIKHEKVKIEMIKDGFQLIWGVRKASEWVLDIKSEKKRQRYSRYLMSRWTQRSQGFLVESDGQPATLPRLRESMKQNADKLQEIVKNLLGKIPPTDVKDPKGIADYAKLITELVASVGKAVSQVEERSFQIAAVTETNVPTAPPPPADLRPQVNLYSTAPFVSQNVLSQIPQMAPIRPVTPADVRNNGVEGVNVTYKGPGLRGDLGMVTPITPGALSHILQPLPPLKTQDPNVDFWVKLKDAVITFSLEYSEVATIIKAKAPLGYASRLADAQWPRLMPDNDVAWEVHLVQCENITQAILGRGYQSFTSLSTCIQGPTESFNCWINRFTEKHRTLAACRTDTPTLGSSFIIDTASRNMNERYQQMWTLGLPVIRDWGEFLIWGQRAEASVAQLNDNKIKIAAVQDVPSHNSYQQRRQNIPPHTPCHKCGKSGHWSSSCRNRQRNTDKPVSSQQRGMDSDTTSEILNLLRSLAKSNITDQ